MRKCKTKRITGPEAARGCTTIGDVERLAGIGKSHEERVAFWQPFARLDNGFEVGLAELYRRIEAGAN